MLRGFRLLQNALFALTGGGARVPNFGQEDEDGQDVRNVARQAKDVHHGGGL